MINRTRILYNSRRVSPPGETLFELLEERRMSQAELAKRTGRPLKTINEIIKGKTAITPETAIQLERVLGAPADFWIQREANYRTYLACQKEYGYLSQYKDWVKEFPIREMKKRDWLEDCGDGVIDQTVSLLNFFGVATPEKWMEGWGQKQFAFRHSAKIETQLGPASAWLRKGEIEAEKIECSEFNERKLKASLNQLRTFTLESDIKKFVPELIQCCAELGIAVVFLEGFERVPISGASLWLKPNKAMILLSLRYKTDDHLWFTFFHELGHILLHSKKDLFVEFDKPASKRPKEEEEADLFSEELLIPQKDLSNWLTKIGIFSGSKIESFAKDIGISPGIVVGRLQHMKKIKFSDFYGLKKRYKWTDLDVYN
jgi:HTH-type transcriptional regulator/antitoxin HigA